LAVAGDDVGNVCRRIERDGSDGGGGGGSGVQSFYHRLSYLPMVCCTDKHSKNGVFFYPETCYYSSIQIHAKKMLM
jgi:hypothetical protein